MGQTGAVSITTLSSRVVYQSPWLSVREDEVEFADGARGRYSVVDRRDFAVVVPAERGGFHLVNQYRYTVGMRCWEFPSGSFPAGVSGAPEEMAAAELAEETGFTARTWRKLGYVHVANGTTAEGADVFLATDLVPGEPDREVSEQDMTQQWFSHEEVRQMIREGVITDGPTLAAYLLLDLQTERPHGPGDGSHAIAAP
jgi:8-oxo-dGTP pyrophosphatase MutT (NUDIX family)